MKLLATYLSAAWKEPRILYLLCVQCRLIIFVILALCWLSATVQEIFFMRWCLWYMTKVTVRDAKTATTYFKETEGAAQTSFKAEMGDISKEEAGQSREWTRWSWQGRRRGGRRWCMSRSREKRGWWKGSNIFLLIQRIQLRKSIGGNLILVNLR